MIKNLEWCCKKQIEPLFNNIKYMDYYEPIKRYSEMNNNIFNNIINKKKINDIIMNYYIKSRTDIYIIILYPNALKYNNIYNKLINILKSNGDIHYIKNLSINYTTSYNLIYQLYANDNKIKTNDSIIYKINSLGFINNNNNEIKVIICTLKDTSKNINIYKLELINLFYNEDLKNTKYKPDDDKYPNKYNYLDISNNINQSYEYANIFLNKNSFNFLKKQQSWRILEMFKSKELINTIKNDIYNYSLNELEKILIYGSSVLYTYGLRETDYINCMVIDKNLLNISIDNNRLNEIEQILNISNYKELIINPKYYYYFMGLKFLKLKYEIKIRLNNYLNNPSQLTDLLIIKQLYKLKYNLPIPNIIKDNYLNNVKTYLKSRYYIKLDNTQIKEWVHNMTGGKNNLLFIKYKDESNNKYVYPKLKDIIYMKYKTDIIIYNDYKPYLYPGETFNKFSSINLCDKEINFIKNKSKSSFRIASFNVHNFITRCNQGIAPIFGESINPYQKSRDLNKFIELFKLTNADIICLQELVPIVNKDINKDITDYNYIRKHFNFSYLNKLMKKLGYKYKIIGSTQKGLFYQNDNNNYYYLANGIYSKFKINKYEILQFSYLNRNIIRCNIKINNLDIDIINLHLEYIDDYNPIIKSKHQTTKQFYDIEEYIKSLKNNNIIICGGFNINLNDNYHSIKTKYINNYFYINNNLNNITNFNQNNITDYIIYHKLSKLKSIYYDTIFTPISDHYLIISDFIHV